MKWEEAAVLWIVIRRGEGTQTRGERKGDKHKKKKTK